MLLHCNQNIRIRNHSKFSYDARLENIFIIVESKDVVHKNVPVYSLVAAVRGFHYYQSFWSPQPEQILKLFSRNWKCIRYICNKVLRNF